VSKKLLMKKSTKNVCLVDGEKVLVNVDSVMHPHQVFIRLSPVLLLGIVNTMIKDDIRYDNVYLWQKVQRGKKAPYNYLGDLTFAGGRRMGNVISIGITVAKELPKKWKRRALRRQHELEKELNICSFSDNVLNSILVNSGFLGSARPMK